MGTPTANILYEASRYTNQLCQQLVLLTAGHKLSAGRDKAEHFAHTELLQQLRHANARLTSRCVTLRTGLLIVSVLSYCLLHTCVVSERTAQCQG